MTKKHFIELADAIRGTDASPAVVDALVGFCKGQNGQFMEQRWRDYLAGECGPSWGKVK